jgi:hypothetical protein
LNQRVATRTRRAWLRHHPRLQLGDHFLGDGGRERRLRDVELLQRELASKHASLWQSVQTRCTMAVRLSTGIVGARLGKANGSSDFGERHPLVLAPASSRIGPA